MEPRARLISLSSIHQTDNRQCAGSCQCKPRLYPPHRQAQSDVYRYARCSWPDARIFPLDHIRRNIMAASPRHRSRGPSVCVQAGSETQADAALTQITAVASKIRDKKARGDLSSTRKYSRRLSKAALISSSGLGDESSNDRKPAHAALPFTYQVPPRQIKMCKAS